MTDLDDPPGRAPRRRANCSRSRRRSSPSRGRAGCCSTRSAKTETRRYTVAVDEGGSLGYLGVDVRDGRAARQHDRHAARRRGTRRGDVAARRRVARRAQSAASRRATLEVAVSNERAQRLYYRYGFAPVGVRKNYYETTDEDALVLWADFAVAAELAPYAGAVATGPRHRDELRRDRRGRRRRRLPRPVLGRRVLDRPAPRLRRRGARAGRARPRRAPSGRSSLARWPTPASTRATRTIVGIAVTSRARAGRFAARRVSRPPRPTPWRGESHSSRSTTSRATSSRRCWRSPTSPGR